jgi:hypothetical protein
LVKKPPQKTRQQHLIEKDIAENVSHISVAIDTVKLNNASAYRYLLTDIYASNIISSTWVVRNYHNFPPFPFGEQI